MKRIVSALALTAIAFTLAGCEALSAPVMLPIMLANDVVGAIQTELERSEPMQEGGATDEDGGDAPVPVETASSSIAYPSNPVSEDGSQ